jgi:lactoylglutathione lyase
MSRLIYTIVFTNNFATMRPFYEDGVGLRVRAVKRGWVEFDTGGALLALHETADETRQGIDLRFEVANLDLAMREHAARRVEFAGDPVAFSEGRVVDLRDPEDNLLSLFEPAVPTVSGVGHRLGTVILNVRDFSRAVAFYRDRMKLRPVAEAPHWVEFDTGSTRLAVHGRPAGVDHPRHAEEAVTFTLESDDLTGWVEGMRGRGLHFLTAPVLEEFGVYAEVADPDGRIVVFREPPEPMTLEEELAEPFEDDAPLRTAIRKPIKKGSTALSSLVMQPHYKPPSIAKADQTRKRPSATTRSVASVRGAGPEGTRLRPRKTGDEKKAKVKPGAGRLAKAKRENVASKKRAVAGASKRRPVKRASAKAARRTR